MVFGLKDGAFSAHITSIMLTMHYLAAMRQVMNV